MSRYNDDPDALRNSFDSLLMMTESLNVPAEQLEKMGLDKNMSLTDNLDKLFDSFVKNNEYLSPEAKQSALISSRGTAPFICKSPCSGRKAYGGTYPRGYPFKGALNGGLHKGR